MKEIVKLELDCGMVLVVQPIPSAASVAVNWLLPAGTATDPDDGDGQAAMLSEFVFRGAGGMSSREHSDAMDRLGVQRSSQALNHHLRFDGTLLGEKLNDALPLLTMVVRYPAMPEDAVDPVRSLCLQSLDGLDDDPQHLVMIRLRERHQAAPFNRSGYGEREVLETVTGEELRQAWAQRFLPKGSIFTAAGAVDPKPLADRLNSLLTDFTGERPEPVEIGGRQRGCTHIEQETAQVHIGLAYDAPREADEHSMLERLAVGVLSGSTSGRLFTEVRQKRSLCYSVGASYRAGRDIGLVALYAGTTPERAQETLDVCMEEILRMRRGVTNEELQRAVIGLKSSLIMQGESTPARAAALGGDYFRLGRARTLDELAEEIDAITLEGLNAYLADREIGESTLVSIGPEPLTMPAS